MPHTKKAENTANILNCYFLEQIYTLAHQTKNLHRKLDLLLINNICLVFSSNAKKTHTDQSILSSFAAQSEMKRLTNFLK